MTIGALSETLKSQNEQLVNIGEGIGQMNASFTKMFASQERQRLQDLEDKRDAEAAAQSEKSTVKAGAKSGGMFSGGMKGMAASMGLGGLMAGGTGGLLRKGGIFGLSQMLSGSIGQSIADMTGDAELGAAAANITKFAGVGALFGKKFALLGAVAGAFATPENMETLGQIGESLGERATQIKDSLKNLGIALPTLSETYKFLSDSSNEVLEGINAIIGMDKEGMQKNITGVTALAGLAGGRNLTNRIKNGPAPKAPAPAKVPEMTKQQRIQANTKTASNLSKKQLAKLAEKGITVGKGGMTQNGKFMSADKMDEALKGVKAPTSVQGKGLADALKKYKRFGKALKLPIIGPMISAGSIGLILANDDLSTKEKTAQIGAALASIGGGILGTAAGALFGAAVGGPFGAGLLGIGGGILGAFSGDYLATEIAKFLMGENSEIIEMGKAQNSAMGETGAVGALPNLAGAGGNPTAQKIPPATAAVIKDANTTADALKTSGGGGAVFAPIQSSTTNSSNSTSLVSSALSTSDRNDPFAWGTRA